MPQLPHWNRMKNPCHDFPALTDKIPKLPESERPEPVSALNPGPFRARPTLPAQRDPIERTCKTPRLSGARGVLDGA